MRHLNINISRYEVAGKEILSGISTIVNDYDRIAVVGGNGAGKTTFMKIVTGEITQYDGSIDNTGGITLGYLAQIHFDDESRTVREELRDAFIDVLNAEKELAVAEKLMAEGGDVQKYTEALERFQMIGGYDFEREIDRVARGIGVFHLLSSKLAEISGGQRTKVALAKMLLLRPNFLLLDEPTNFIDLQSAEWLETYLQETWKGGYMIISHDREFLDATCSIVYEVTPEHTLEIYHGNYSKYIAEKEKRELKMTEEYERHQEFLKSEKALINRFRAGSRASFAKSRERQLEKLDEVPPPQIPERPKFLFNFSERPSEKIFEFKECFIGRGEPLFFIREITMRSHDRIGIVGENGVGKSTLLKTILGKLELLDGYFSHAKWLDVIYYSQMHEEIDFKENVVKNFEKHGFFYTREKIASIIGNYNLSYADLDKKLFEFSGGQVSKILFAILGQKSSNILILDEPTNHLDYDSREALEMALKKYPGPILFISHDRYFVNKLATHLWLIEDGELILSYGNYADYKLKKERGINYDIALWNDLGEMELVLEEKLGKAEAKRIREKFGKKAARR